MSIAATLRMQIDQALDAGQSGRAIALLRHLWRTEPSLAQAPFVVDRMAKVEAPLPPVLCRLFIMRSFTVEPVLPLLKASAACWGIQLEANAGQFNSYMQEMLDPRSPLYENPADVAILAVQTRDIAPELWTQAAELDESGLSALVERVLESYRNSLKAFRSRSQTHLVVHNLEQPSLASTGIFDSQQHDGQRQTIQRINAGLAEMTAEFTGVYVLDYDGLAARHGRDRWSDEKKWLTARLPLAAGSLIHLSNEWLKYLAPLSGKQAKCIVCDLDNTLWGGIIGEDGLEGIRLGAEYPGAGYQQLQRALLDMTRRGILLAICSKNNESDAFEVFDNHPDMLLKRSDFAAMRINWNDKVQNLREIAAELNIGIDSLVFLDDNPVEREFIREVLPDVHVLELDAANPLGYSVVLRDCPLVERLEISAEDRKRNQLYAEQQQRSVLAASASTVEDYYRSLDMVAEMGEVNAMTLARVAQLTQKTNQLNMTTRRYSEQQIQHFQNDPHTKVYWTRVLDRFGDNGIIGVIITRQEGNTWDIDTFLMSCRVIGRTVETAMLGMLVEQARQHGIQRLTGQFLPSAKNAPAREIYVNNGFSCTAETNEGSRWELDVNDTSLATPEWIECRFLREAGATT